MTTVDTIVVVDWSAANDRGARPVADAIWAATWRESGPAPPVYLRNRAVAEAWLADLIATEIAAGRRVLAGFDFPFGYPAGFAARVVGRPDTLALWDWFAENLSDTPRGNNRFALAARLNARFPGVGPFWFNGLKDTDFDHLPRKGRARTGHGMPERRACERAARGTFPLWQMGGAGAVGGQAMTGMATLARLRARFPGALRAWPFEPLDGPVALVEVWPSLMAREVAARSGPDDMKDAVQVAVLADHLAALQADGRLCDALVAVPDAARAEEGWIFGVAPPMPPSDELHPPRLRDDCFAMPQGVDWVPVDDALARLRAVLHPVAGVERVPVAAAAGRVLAKAPVARRANPPTANAALDGYAFAHAATGAGVQRLPLAPGRAAAGAPFAGTVPAGHAVRILTGAILPRGADTVVMEEDTATDGNTVAFDGPVKPGANTRAAGEDVAAGAGTLPAGHRLRAPDLALLTAVGVAEVAVRRRLRVAILSTGDEIVADPADPAAAHQIWDANRPMLLAMVAGWGHEAVDLGRAPDTPHAIATALDRGAAQADAILTSGGASAGDEDHVSALLRARGRLTAWRIAVKPGRPLALATWAGAPVFGLPGNPVAAMVCAAIFARPALSCLAGAGWTEPRGVTVPAGFTKSKKAGRHEILRARLDDAGRAEVFASEGSGRISGLAWATGFVVLEAPAADIVPGTPVRYLSYAELGIG